MESRTPEEIRAEIERERNELARSVDTFRAEIKDATDVRSKIAANLPVAAAGAFAVGFVLSGGIGATVRLIFRRGREGDTVGRIGRFVLINRD